MKSQIIKIFVSYHKPEHLLKNDVYMPLHVGRANSTLSCDEISLMETEMPGDDTAENISTKNASYAELTGIYWVWKNYACTGGADYIGFTHYRRFMIFNPREQGVSVITLPNFSKREVEYYLPMAEIRKVASEYDLMVPKRVSVSEEKTTQRLLTLAEHWKIVHGTEHLGQALDCARHLFPECGEVIDEYIHSTSGYWWNMLIARREIINEYCHFIFSILEEMEKTQSFEECTGYNRRMPGYIAERLTGIFIMMKQRNPGCKVGEFSTVCLTGDVQHKNLNTTLLVGYQWKHFWYGLLSNLTFGSMRQKYRQKRRFAKDMLRHIRKMLKISHLVIQER